MANVIVVDDSAMMRKRLSTILTQAGHSIAGECGSGEEVLSAYMKYQPDLVTLDINMPGMDGIATLRALKEYDPKARVILISSDNNNTVVREGIRAGAMNYILKPFQDEIVAKTVFAVLKKSGYTPSGNNKKLALEDHFGDIKGIILLIDDSKLFMQSTADILVKDGHNILTASSGRSGINLATTGSPDLILLDIVMPDMDGYDVFKELKKDEMTRKTPIIIYSSLTKKEDILTAMKMGIQEYISKDCDESVLRLKVKSALYQGKVERERMKEEAVQNIILTQSKDRAHISFRNSLASDNAMEERKKVLNSAFIKTVENKHVILDFRDIDEFDRYELRELRRILTTFSKKALLIVCGKHYSTFITQCDTEGQNQYFISMGDMELWLDTTSGKSNDNKK